MGSDFFMCIQSMTERLGANPIAVQIPIGSEDAFRGSIDLISMKAYIYDDETLGAQYVVEEIPQDLLAQALEYREKMMEALADFNDEIMEKYLAGEEIS